MISASSSFIDALRFGNYLSIARLTVLTNGVATQYQVPISDMTVTVDRNSEYRRQGQMTAEPTIEVPPSVLVPTTPQAVLAPFGNEIFAEFAVITDPADLNSPNNEWIPLGTFAIATSVAEDSTVNVVITLDLYDRSWVIAQRKLLAPYNVPAAGGDFPAEIEALLNQVWAQSSNMPALQYNITPTSYVVPSGTYNQGEDPWQAALDMAMSAGYELFFDVNGVVTGYPIPDPTTRVTAWTFNENSVGVDGILNPPNTSDYAVSQSPYSTPVGVTVTMTRDGIFNDFWVSATGPNNAGGTGYTTPVQVQAADNNPASPTYIGGGMGNVPSFVTDSLITTSAQALAEAQYDLAQGLAKSWTVSVSTPPNPLFDVDDVYAVVNPRLGMASTRVVTDTISFSCRYDVACVLTGRVVP